jgi:hypothetical protein
MINVLVLEISHNDFLCRALSKTSSCSYNEKTLFFRGAQGKCRKEAKLSSYGLVASTHISRKSFVVISVIFVSGNSECRKKLSHFQ